ncbi:MAG: MMPL family transporter [Nitrosospira sp.]|nr:MMPL family transporter [Nitrosospira sp.]MBI0419005.1 MMPL family transporter [Nitrosospira sp.]MDW7652932.1 MMPL family transporter [Nitrosomonadaceae bacterium]
MEASKSHLYKAFARWTSASYRHAPWVLFLMLLIAAACTVYISRNLGMNTDTTDMLSEDLPFRAHIKHYNKIFPQDMNNLLLVLEAPTPEQAYVTADRLATLLKKDAINFYDVYPANIDPFFEKNGLLYKDIPELERITDRLATAQPLIARIAKDPSLQNFASVLSEAIGELRKGRNLDLTPVLNGMSTTVEAKLTDIPRVLSWEILFHGDPQKKKYRELIIVKPRLNYTQIFPAEQSILAIHAAAKDAGLMDNSPIRIRITGEAALADEELRSSINGMEYAGILTFLMVVIVLYCAMRAAGMVLAVLLCLTLGLILTATFATVAIGHLNVISIAFAVLYIGLGADFAIHFLLRYHEILETNLPVEKVTYKAGGEAGSALTACTIVNAIGFYAFIPTHYSGVAELGIISGTGMLISLLVTLTIGPALLRYLPKKSIKELTVKKSLGGVLESLLRWRKLTYSLTLLALFSTVVMLPKVRFDYNLFNMQDPTGQAIQTFQELISVVDNSPWHAIMVAKNRKEAERLTQQFRALPEVNKVVTIIDFVPTQQEEKIFLIEEMAAITGPITLSIWPPIKSKHTSAQQRNALNELSAALDQFIEKQPDHSASESVRTLKKSLIQLFTRLDTVSSNDGNILLDSLESDLLTMLPIALQHLRTSSEAVIFNEQDLPVSISNRWHSQTGEYRIAIYPKEDINDNEKLRKFVRSIQQVAPQATGAPIISLEAGEAVVQAFIEAFSLSLVGILIALLLILRSVKYTLLVMIPLLLSSAFTGAFTVLLDVPFNFANIIALPLLLGIGIDSSLHMVHRSRNNDLISGTLMHSSTARAIFYSALTALVDFASLMFSSHQGTASMGILLTVGLTFTLICTLLILPTILKIPTQNNKTISHL